MTTIALLNSTTTTTTTTFSPVLDTINTTNCYWKIIDCQFPISTADHFGPTVNPTTNVSTATVMTTNMPTTTTEIQQVRTTNVLTATTVTQQAETTLLMTAATDGHTTDRLVSMGYVHSTGFDSDGGDDGTTFNPLDEKWTWSDNESTTEKDFKNVDDLQITAEIVNYDTSSEFTAVEPNVSPTTYDTTDNSTMDSTTESFNESTESSIIESMTSSTAESMKSLMTESISSLDTEFISNTTTQSVSTMKSESYDATTNDQWTDEVSSSKTRMKRIPEINYNGTHCTRLVCSPPSPVSKSDVTKEPNSSQGFSKDSSKYYNFNEYYKRNAT